jgi:serine/threonine protein kinase
MLTYVAPETSGALECNIRTPSDLYSLGIMPLEYLTGEPLFQGQNACERLFLHMTPPVPDLKRMKAPANRELFSHTLRGVGAVCRIATRSQSMRGEPKHLT